MIRDFLTNIIKKKNPDFTLDKAVGIDLLLQLVFSKVFQRLRSLKLLLYFRFPEKLFLGKNVRFFNVNNIVLGKWVQLEDEVVVSALCKNKVTIGDNFKIGAFSRIIASTSFNNIGEHIHIGNNVGIGEYAYLGGGGGLTIGNDCIVGQYFSCHPENHNYEHRNELIRLQGVSRKGIVVGNNCWIGAKVTILDGVRIGNNCIIAAGAVVTKSMPANSIIGGVPAKVLKSRVPDMTLMN